MDMKNNEIVVEFDNVSISYVSGVYAIEDVSFKVARGEFIAIIGPNGGGKTTIINAMLGFVKPTKGKIMLFGKPVEKFKEWHKIGYVPQNIAARKPALPITVKEFLSSLTRDKREIERVIELVGLEENLDSRVVDLSLGNFQRLYIAAALVNRPELLILDEPTSSVDQPFQEDMYKILQQENKHRNITVVMVSHDISAVSTLSSSVLCVNRRINHISSVKELFESEELCRLYGFHVYAVEHSHR